jgi:hypothetical protein
MRRLSSENFSFFRNRHARTYEKSAKGYISFFNAKGFSFVKGKKVFEVNRFIPNNRTGYTLAKRTSQYLSSIPDLTTTLNKQEPIIMGLVENGRNNLKNLWAGHLMESGVYDRVTFMLTNEKAYPNLHREMVQHWFLMI